MKITDRELWIDETVSLYLEAFENDDFDAQDRIWKLAERDAELAETMHSLHRGLIEEQKALDERTIARSVSMAMPSARIERESNGPITVADVAEELFHTAGKSLAGDGYAWIEKLRLSSAPLPDDLRLSKLSAWAEAQFGPAPAGFWKVFHNGAIKLEQRRASEKEYSLAARRAPNPEGNE